jgi:transposase
MFARVKSSGQHQYLQIVQNRREGAKTVQRVVATIGRMDQLQQKGQIENLVRSLSRFSEKVLLILSGKSDAKADAKKIGPNLIFARLWRDLGIGKIIKRLLGSRKFGFDVERAIYLTVLHRLFVSGSDRSCDRWRRDYVIDGVEELSLHQLYRAMAFLGEMTDDQRDCSPFGPRCTKDVIEEDMFLARRDLFSTLDCVFFDTTSLYFEGEGGETIGTFGHSKDHRPDLHQMVVGAILDNEGQPVCCEMWQGNATDVKSLVPVMERLRNRFAIGQICIVADRGMISKDVIKYLEGKQIPYILGSRMRKTKEVKEQILSRAGRYREVHPEGARSKDPSPLKVKEVQLDGRRYIVCLNTKQARKDAASRQAIVESLLEKLASDPKSLVGNKGYQKYLKLNRDTVSVNQQKIDEEARYDGKWVLRTNTTLTAEQVALKYKELWQVEHVFRDMKSVLDTRPIFHKRDATIRGHVFCSFLALALRKELDRRLEKAGNSFEWSDIKQDLKALQEITIEDGGKTLAIRSECLGTCGKVFQAAGVAIPPTIKEVVA